MTHQFKLRRVASLWAFGLGSAFAQAPGQMPAQMPVPHAHPTQAQVSSPTTAGTALPWVEAEVRRVDLSAGKIGLKHGPIPNLDMPPMNMVFQVQDKALLGSAKTGDRVRVQVDQINGAYTVMALEPAP